MARECEGNVVPTEGKLSWDCGWCEEEELPGDVLEYFK